MSLESKNIADEVTSGSDKGNEKYKVALMQVNVYHLNTLKI